MKQRLETLIDEKLNSNKKAPCYWWDSKWYSTEEFLSLVDATEKTLKASGFGRGQRLVALMKNCPMIPALSLAVWRLGGSICPLNIAAGSDSLTGTINLLDPFAVVVSDAVKEDAIKLLKDMNFVSVTCMPEGKLPEFQGKPTKPESDELAVIFATSGTTGLPKAVPLSHTNLLDNCHRIFEAVTDLAEGDVYLSVLPNFHSFGYTVSTVLPLVTSSCQAIVPAFLPPQQAMKAIAEAPVDILFAVPAIFSYLLGAVERGSFSREAMQKPKLLISGGDRLSPTLHEQALRLVGKDIMEGYGLTETSPVAAVNRNYASNKPGTIGPLLGGFEMHLRTREGQRTDGNEGVLWLKGDSVTKGYFRAPEITAERFEGDWFNTGDYVRVDEDGYLTVLDRVTDIIIVGGFNVYPQEVERVLSMHPAVRTAIVVGEPHSVNGEVPKAYVLKKDGEEATPLELVKFCKQHLAHFKVPRSVEFVDEFPLSGTGKILRRVLRDRAAQGHHHKHGQDTDV